MPRGRPAVLSWLGCIAIAGALSGLPACGLLRDFSRKVGGVSRQLLMIPHEYIYLQAVHLQAKSASTLLTSARLCSGSDEQRVAIHRLQQLRIRHQPTSLPALPASKDGTSKAEAQQSLQSSSTCASTASLLLAQGRTDLPQFRVQAPWHSPGCRSHHVRAEASAPRPESKTLRVSREFGPTWPNRGAGALASRFLGGSSSTRTPVQYLCEPVNRPDAWVCTSFGLSGHLNLGWK